MTNISTTVNTISGMIIDVINETVYGGTIEIYNGNIAAITKDNRSYPHFIIPGFIDSHIHIESSMLVPHEFARIAVMHGTVGVVADPHEIANVLGIAGINYMIKNGETTPFKFYWGASSSVPPTPFESSGATINAHDVKHLLARSDISFLGEVMDVSGVLSHDSQTLTKISEAQKAGKKIDGHAPGLRGEALQEYIDTGISTDHESYSYDEALEKIKRGMLINIREGSAAKNFDTLVRLIDQYPNQCMFCSDDKSPHDLLKGHINQLVIRAIAQGCGLMNTLRSACVNPVKHYGLTVGLLQPSDPADFLVVDNLRDFTILQTYIDGNLVADNGFSAIRYAKASIINNFKVEPKLVADFNINPQNKPLHVIEAYDGQLITKNIIAMPTVTNHNTISDTFNDILKITVVNRYCTMPPALGFIKNFGLKSGALASSIAHDCHNIIALGVTDDDLCRAVNLIITHKGGICIITPDSEHILPLPIAGLMSDQPAEDIAHQHQELNTLAKKLGCTFQAPFMTLSFMALLVIPEIKLSDRGLFNGKLHKFIPLFTEVKK
jgi:adenine deaminase